MPEGHSFDCPFCRKPSTTKAVANHIQSQHPLEADLLRNGELHFAYCEHLVSCKVCGLPFEPDDRPEHVRREHPEVAIRKRASRRGAWTGIAIAFVVLGAVGYGLGAKIETQLHPFGALYDSAPRCPQNSATYLEFDVDPSDAAKVARVLSWHNWTNIQILDLGHMTSDGSSDTSENHSSPLLTVTGYCPEVLVPDFVGPPAVLRIG